MTVPTLTTKRLTLRPLRVHDTPAIFEMMSDEETMRFWDWPAFRDESTVRDIVAAQVSDMEAGTARYWAVAYSPNASAIGSVDLSEIDAHHSRAEVGFLFARKVWGKGFAREAMQAVTAHAFDALGIRRLWARFHTGNAASQRLLESLGFAREGTLKGHIQREGARRDCEIYGLMR